MNRRVMVGSSDPLMLANIAFVTMLVTATSVSSSDSSMKTKPLIEVMNGEGGGKGDEEDGGFLRGGEALCGLG